MKQFVLIRGGGDLASGVALRLFHSGMQVVICELPQPLCVRRTVSFAEAVYQESCMIEDVTAVLANEVNEIRQLLDDRKIPVIVDPDLNLLNRINPDALVDARLLKIEQAPIKQFNLVIGLGPGFEVGFNCHAVVETMRGPYLGRVYWQGKALPDTGIPEQVCDHQSDRVQRAPASGVFQSRHEIGDWVEVGEELASVGKELIQAPFAGLIRGMLHDGLQVNAGMKVGDIDPRKDLRLIHLVSDKSLAIGGGVLEAILSYQARGNLPGSL